MFLLKLNISFRFVKKTAMKVISTVKELQNEIRKLQLAPVGFVPTMGALHAGHLSLVAAAADRCPVVVVSIYVNPTQFNDKNDLRNYPRMIDSDLKLLKKNSGKPTSFSPLMIRDISRRGQKEI